NSSVHYLFPSVLSGNRFLSQNAMKFDPLLGTIPIQRNLSSPTEMGFRCGDKGTHTSRTLMLAELTSVFEVCPPDAQRERYAEAVLDHNCLSKRTVVNRKLSLQRLSELYGLDPHILLFRVLRRQWELDDTGRPLLTLLAALARDPLLRLTVPP